MVTTAAETVAEPTTEAVAEALSRYRPAVVAEASATEARLSGETTAATKAAIAVSAEATTGKSNLVGPAG